MRPLLWQRPRLDEVHSPRHGVTMRRRWLFALIASTLPALLCGCRATPPSRTEEAVIRWTKHTITVKGRHDKNPVPATAQKIEAGKQTFASYCIVCHGRDGQNTGV